MLMYYLIFNKCSLLKYSDTIHAFFKMWKKKVEEAVAIGKKAIRDH